MGLKESGLRGSLRNVSVGIDAIPDSGLDHEYDLREESFSDQDTLSSLTDRTGSNNLSASGDPTAEIDGINGNQSVLLDGVDDEFSGGVHNLGSEDEYTVAFVFEMESFDTEASEYLVDNGGSYAFNQDDSNEWQAVHLGIAAISGGSSDTDPHIAVIAYDGDNWILEIDGVEVASDSGVNIDSPSGDLIWGARSSGDNANVRLGHMLHYSQFYDGSGRSDIYNGLSSDWGF